MKIEFQNCEGLRSLTVNFGEAAEVSVKEVVREAMEVFFSPRPPLAKNDKDAGEDPAGPGSAKDPAAHTGGDGGGVDTPQNQKENPSTGEKGESLDFFPWKD